MFRLFCCSVLLGTILGCSPQEKEKIITVQVPVETTNSDLQMYGDIWRDLLNDPSYTAVTRDFGPTVIKARTFPYKSEIAVAKITPWSSWWFPKKDALLFSVDQGLSVLEKYDLINRNKFAGSISAVAFEKANYNPQALPWEGLCDAWALASMMEVEPQKNIKWELSNGKDIALSVYEQKALLLKTYEAVSQTELKIYGQKFTGNADSWIYPDLFPDQFHRFLEVQLFQNKQTFVMDHDAGVEVWNVPVFKANFTMESVAQDPNAVFVRTWIYSAESVPANEKDFVGSRVAVREYDYVLQGKRNADGDLVVESGYWWSKGPTGINSRNAHPDYVLFPMKTLTRRSWNPAIEAKVVDQILRRSGFFKPETF